MEVHTSIEFKKKKFKGFQVLMGILEYKNMIDVRGYILWREIPRSWSLIIFYFFYIQVGVFDGFGQKPYWGRNLAAFLLVSGRNPKVRPCHSVCL